MFLRANTPLRAATTPTLSATPYERDALASSESFDAPASSSMGGSRNESGSFSLPSYAARVLGRIGLGPHVHAHAHAPSPLLTPMEPVLASKRLASPVLRWEDSDEAMSSQAPSRLPSPTTSQAPSAELSAASGSLGYPYSPSTGSETTAEGDRLLRKSFAWRRRCHATGSGGSHNGSKNKTSRDGRRREESQKEPHQALQATAAGHAATGPTAVAASSALMAKGIVDAFGITPCPVALQEMMRVVLLPPECQRRYVTPPPQLLSQVQGSALFMRVLENIRRRGPETFGATRRLLDEECVLRLPCPSPQVPTTESAHGKEKRARAETATATNPQHTNPTDAGDAAVDVQELVMKTELQGISAVLGLRGHATIHQPFEMEVETDLEEEDERATKPVNKSFLQWNGEIFNGAMCPPPWGSDTIVLASRLSQLEQECVPTSETDPMNHVSLRDRQALFLARCVQVFEEEVQGPYGFLFYANQLQLAVFGRDPLGRHSLLAHIALYKHAPARGETPAAAVEVELIISSVGIQHAAKMNGSAASKAAGPTPALATTLATTGATASSADGEPRKRPRPTGTNESPLQDTCDTETPVSAPRDAAHSRPDGACDTHTAPVAAETTTTSPSAPSPSGARPTSERAAAKPTHPKGNRKATKKSKTEVSPSAAGGDMDEDESGEAAAPTTTAIYRHGATAHASLAVEEDESLHGCWAELPVSGLFAVPLDRPLVSEDVLLSTAPALENPEKDAQSSRETGTRLGDSNATAAKPVTEACKIGACACGHATVASSSPPCDELLLDEAGVATAQAKGILMHCPWRDRYHLVHPLLRAFVAITEQEKEALQQQQQPQDQEKQGAPVEATAPPSLPFGLPMKWAPPMRPLLFSSEDTVPALPALLAQRIGDFAPPPGASDDAVWAHWAATCYLHALSAAVMRRTDVAAAGAEDSRDWSTYIKALRRPLCVLFSGGIDCTVLAALAHHVLPLETPIELVNVAFGPTPEQAPDRLAALRAVEELLRLPQPSPHEDSLAAAASLGMQAATEREWRLVLVDVPSKLTDDTGHILDLVTPRHTVMDLDIGTALWYAARGAGRMQVLRHSDVVNAPLGSGGLPGSHSLATGGGTAPATVTSGAGMYGANPESVGLLHGFNKHVRVAPVSGQRTDYGSSNSGHHTLPFHPSSSHGTSEAPPIAEDPKFHPLLEVLITEGRQGEGPCKPVLLSTLGKEYGPVLQPVIASYGYKKIGAYLNDACKAGLIQFDHTAASKAVMLVRAEDKARAWPPPPCPWYATPWMQAQQQQRVSSANGATPGEVATAETPITPPPGTYSMDYVSSAKVILVGMGADETLGGYTRYRRFFGRHGMQGTRQELEKDFARLWMRNLGRDDRITMDSGREPRFPYLDEELLMTLEKIVAERRKALLSGDSSDTDSSFSHLLKRKAAATATEVTEGAKVDVPTDEDMEAALLQTSLEPILSFRLGLGEGDKRVLRNVAAMIGLETVTRLQKRAIQFGTRIADRRVSGTTEL